MKHTQTKEKYDPAREYSYWLCEQAAIENAYNRYKNIMPISEAMAQALKNHNQSL